MLPLWVTPVAGSHLPVGGSGDATLPTTCTRVMLVAKGDDRLGEGDNCLRKGNIFVLIFAAHVMHPLRFFNSDIRAKPAGAAASKGGAYGHNGQQPLTVRRPQGAANRRTATDHKGQSPPA
ncbi:hypothetical protein GW17_00055550 [Ensete ventricosum]|nr:hypothetical protein GW17_00055550 [Ensete ventricosum]